MCYTGNGDNWLCAAYQVVKNPASSGDTYPQLTIRGIGYACSLLVLHECDLMSSCGSAVKVMVDLGSIPSEMQMHCIRKGIRITDRHI